MKKGSSLQVKNIYIQEGEIRKDEVFSKFVSFCAMPDPEKCEMLGIVPDPITGKRRTPKATDFAKMFGVSNTTLSLWKRRSDFGKAVHANRITWGKEKIPNVMAALYNRCIKYGMAYDVETFLAYFDNWDRKQVIRHEIVKFDANDLRSIISKLPDEKQKKAYEAIADIIAEAELAGTSEASERDNFVGHTINSSEVGE